MLFVDTTLRDGEQSAGIVFNRQEKVRIAKLLDQAGVWQIEAGIPVMGRLEMEAIQDILALNLKARISAWNRANLKDVQASLACGVKYMHISAPVSDIHIRYKLNRSRAWVLDQMQRAVSYARESGCEVTVGAEDASRADPEFLYQFGRLAQKEGAVQLRYADTLGLMEPFSIQKQISRMINNTGLAVEFHGHNDFGLATANALSAALAGAQYLSTTVLGLGERAGNSSFKEVVRALSRFSDIPVSINEEKIPELESYVAWAAGRIKNLA